MEPLSKLLDKSLHLTSMTLILKLKTQRISVFTTYYAVTEVGIFQQKGEVRNISYIIVSEERFPISDGMPPWR